MNTPPKHEWEQALDMDDSDLRLTPVLCPTNNPHILLETTTTTQTIFSTQNHQIDTCGEKPVRIIPCPASIVQGECFGDIKKFCKNGKLEKFVSIIKSCTPNTLGNLMVTLKDPSGIISVSIHYQVLTDEWFGKAIIVGAALIRHSVSAFSPNQSNHYLNITKKNMVFQIMPPLSPRVGYKKDARISRHASNGKDDCRSCGSANEDHEKKRLPRQILKIDLVSVDVRISIMSGKPHPFNGTEEL
ncbi:putative nucleotidyltransferase, ribonuclease H [Tanacetum coccineum]|uniref:Nucleotidyltransferase, ribonuclease H n=1 Tax=Tanacetum coccineum TaxID=301880 RepID=A0ABQ5HF79_9ASTR